MANVVVVGAQWGDEGKGKIVDWLSVGADVVVRFQGGHNAGHTLVIDGKVFKLALLPSGIVRPGKLSVIGNGVVLDPYHLIDEIEKIRGQGVEVTPGKAQDRRERPADPVAAPRTRRPPRIGLVARHQDRHDQARHRTGLRGQGRPPRDPPHGPRRARTRSTTRSSGCSPTTTRSAAGSACPPPSASAIRDELLAVAPKILPFMAPTFALLDRERRAGKRILFEGAQGALLDVDHGTYPFVTSSNTVAANAATGSGMGPRAIGYVLGIAKAYVTRVGAGPFPTEQDNDVGRLIGRRGNEFGTNTGRPRRCGWFDAVLARQAARICGIDGIALTKLDILDGFDEIKVAIGYRLDGKEIDYLPASQSAQARIEPIYETIEGWKGVTSKARSWADLPAQAIKYVRRIEELVGVPVALLSTSPERDDTILVHDPFQD